MYGEYNNIIEAAKSISCNEKTIIKSLKTDKKVLLRGLIVSYV